MLSFWDGDSRSRRRHFLQAGTLGLGGLQLSGLLQQSARASTPTSVVKNKSVIFLFLHGGPGQTETFDPKMTAPVGIQSVTGELQTKLPGVTFGGTFPRLAGLADKLSVVRSFVTGDGNHDIKPIVSRETLNANLGSLYARVAGTNREGSGIPTNVALFPRAVVEKARPAVTSFGDFTSTGNLGGGYKPFVPGSQGEAQENMRLQFDRTRLDDPDDISRRCKNHQNYVDNVQSLGKLLLLARRLCESGCGFVTVTTNFVPTLSGTCTPMQITLAWKKECVTWAAPWIMLCLPSLKKGSWGHPA